jgi:hypothetical protein
MLNAAPKVWDKLNELLSNIEHADKKKPGKK